MSLNTKALDALVPNLNAKLGIVVRKTAFDAQALAQQAIPRDTGAAGNSIYVQSERASEYGDKKSAVLAANPKAEVFDEIQSGELETQVTAAVSAILAVMVYYGIYLEFGTAKMAARPFFLQAVAAVEANFIKGCSQAVKEAAQGGVILRTQL